LTEISIIAAVADNRVIGKGLELPWYLPPDLKYFRSITMGKPIVMGRLTFDSVGSPLPGRTNIVVSSNKDVQIDGVKVANSIDQALSLAQKESARIGVGEIIIAGGAQIYEATLNLCTRIYITEVHQNPEGDIFFPIVDWDAWSEVSRKFHSPANGWPAFSFVVYEAK